MANVGNFDRQRMHTQLHGKANFRELTHREDVLRYRRINQVLIILVILLIGYTILRIRFGINELAIWFGVIGVIFLLVLLYRIGFIKKKFAKKRMLEKPKKGNYKKRSSPTMNKSRKSNNHHKSRRHSYHKK
jgi:hypothetical protein